MKINSIVNRYMVMEMVPPFLLNLFFFTFIFLLSRILDITNMIVNYKIGLGTILLMLLYSMPYFLVFVVPMSVMMTVLLTFLGMSTDNEILALKSCGVSLYQLIPSVLLFCALGGLLTGIMINFGLPWGRLSLKALTVRVATANLDIGLKERTFNDRFEGVMLYVNRIDPRSRDLIDVFIRDQRDEKVRATILSPRGRLYSSPDRPAFRMRLHDGTINQVDIETRSVNTARFETYDITLDLRRAVASVGRGPKDEKEMYPGELADFLDTYGKKDARYYQALLEFHKKLSIPFACLALGILAVPLGVQSKFSRRSFGLGLGLTFFLLYYLLLSAGLVFGENGSYPPAVGVWVPNIVMGGLGIYLFLRVAADRPVRIIFIPFLIHRAKSLILRRRGAAP